MQLPDPRRCETPHWKGPREVNAPGTLKPKKLYRWLTWHARLEKAVGALSDQQLRMLNGYLAKSKSGIPGMIHSLIRNEAATRLMIQKHPKNP